MCGRFYIDDDETIVEMQKLCKEISLRYQDTPRAAEMKTGEIRPTDVAPVLIAEHQAVLPVLMTWGYPKWQEKGVVINARAETAADRPMFRSSIQQRRCIIPSNGFFEWAQVPGKAKTKFLLHRSESPMLNMAGLYSIFEDPRGEKYAAFVILTVGANPTVRAMHDRMPLVVEPGQNDKWLFDESYARTITGTPCLAEMKATEL